ncbi:MAG TPA: hypothetical protein VNO55_26080, partial [Polyangia bacterium]|nr:hypothetical protein [Polyangia bacterium]
MRSLTLTSMLTCLGVLALLSSGCSSLHPPGGSPTTDAGLPTVDGAAGEDAPGGRMDGAAGGDVANDQGGGTDPASPGVNVFTRGYDNQRTGVNPSETALVPALLTPARFGRLFQLPIDDEVYAQPLYASAITVAGKKRNVLYVATTSNTVYAFDADAPGDPLWQRNFNGAGQVTHKSQVGQSCQPYLDFTATIGIVGTPVIDGATSTMYFVTRTIEGVS